MKIIVNKLRNHENKGGRKNKTHKGKTKKRSSEKFILHSIGD